MTSLMLLVTSSYKKNRIHQKTIQKYEKWKGFCEGWIQIFHLCNVRWSFQSFTAPWNKTSGCPGLSPLIPSFPPLTPFLLETTTQSNPHESICCPTLLLAFPSPTHSSFTRSLCGAQALLAAVPRHTPMCSPEEHTPLAATTLGLSTFLFSQTVLTPSCSRGNKYFFFLKQITHCQRSI